MLTVIDTRSPSLVAGSTVTVHGPASTSTPGALAGSTSAWRATRHSTIPPASRIASPQPIASSSNVRVFTGQQARGWVTRYAVQMSARRAVLGSVVALLAAGCGSGDAGRTGAPTTSPAPRVTSAPVTRTPATSTPVTTRVTSNPATTPATLAEDTAPVPFEILDFRATLVGGKPFDVAELSGKPVVFWFWAPT